nr:DUF5412 domain-containing protein [Streptohalobacillus salinus]
MKNILITNIILLSLLGYGIYRAFFDMSSLPTGEFLTEETSPDGNYTLKAYLANGGATTAYAIRGELVFNTSKGQTKNIYWNYRESTAEIEWKDNYTVMINGHTLNVPSEKYDFRNR